MKFEYYTHEQNGERAIYRFTANKMDKNKLTRGSWNGKFYDSKGNITWYTGTIWAKPYGWKRISRARARQLFPKAFKSKLNLNDIDNAPDAEIKKHYKLLME